MLGTSRNRVLTAIALIALIVFAAIAPPIVAHAAEEPAAAAAIRELIETGQ